MPSHWKRVSRLRLPGNFDHSLNQRTPCAKYDGPALTNSSNAKKELKTESHQAFSFFSFTTKLLLKPNARSIRYETTNEAVPYYPARHCRDKKMGLPTRIPCTTTERPAGKRRRNTITSFALRVRMYPAAQNCIVKLEASHRTHYNCCPETRLVLFYPPQA